MSAQAPGAADGPWSGQMQCALSVRGPNYQDDQTHTWRITPGPPVFNGVFTQWPAVLLNINGAISGATINGATRAPIVSALQEWPFPIIDELATATTISGTRTRVAPNGSGWRQAGRCAMIRRQWVAR